MKDLIKIAFIGALSLSLTSCYVAPMPPPPPPATVYVVHPKPAAVVMVRPAPLLVARRTVVVY